MRKIGARAGREIGSAPRRRPYDAIPPRVSRKWLARDAQVTSRREGKRGPATAPGHILARGVSRHKGELSVGTSFSRWLGAVLRESTSVVSCRFLEGSFCPMDVVLGIERPLFLFSFACGPCFSGPFYSISVVVGWSCHKRSRGCGDSGCFG